MKLKILAFVLTYWASRRTSTAAASEVPRPMGQDPATGLCYDGESFEPIDCDKIVQFEPGPNGFAPPPEEDWYMRLQEDYE